MPQPDAPGQQKDLRGKFLFAGIARIRRKTETTSRLGAGNLHLFRAAGLAQR
jgi:hypothetical protein